MAYEKLLVKQVPKESRNQKVLSRRAYVDWVNKVLKAHFTNTNEFRNGAMYVQLLDSLFPGAISLDDVKFSAQNGYDCYQNFCILDEAFKKLGINKSFNAKALSEGRHVESWDFLKWFKIFYDKNFLEIDYDPLKARKNAFMGFGKNCVTIKSEMLSKKNTSPSPTKAIDHSRLKANSSKGKISKEKNLNVVEPLKEKRQVQSVNSGKVEKSVYHRKIEEKSSKVHKIGKTSPLGTVENSADSRSLAESTGSMNSSVKTVTLNLDRPHGDFEPNMIVKQKSQDPNVHSIVFEKSASFGELKINISDNIKIRFEDIKNASMKRNLNDPQKRRKIHLLLEKFLEFQWVERKDYLDSIVESLRRGA